MKKGFFAVIGIFAVATFGLAACNTLVPPSPPEGESVYDKLTEFARLEYDAITLNVSTTLDGVTLAGIYSMTTTEEGIRVEYTYEKMNLIEKNEDGSYTVPDTVKSTHTGVGTIVDGVFTLESGEAIDIAISRLNVGMLSFAQHNFKNVADEQGKFTADVENPAAFLQTQLTCTAMKTEIAYTSTALSSVHISYTSSENAQIVLTYTFS